MAMVSFKKGLLSALPTTHSAGTFYVTTDERAIYLDVTDSARIRLGDFQEFASVAALEANQNPSESALYYVTDINCLAKWDGSKYVQINRDTGATNIEVSGEGNAVTAAVYDANSRKITLTKGATYVTSGEVQGLISDKVGELKIGSTTYNTVKEYVDQKTSGIASSSEMSALTNRVKTAEDDIDALEGLVGSTKVSTQISDAIEGLNLPNTYAAKSHGHAIADVTGLQAALDGKQAAGDYALSSELEALDDKVGDLPVGATSSNVVTYIGEAIQNAASNYTVSVESSNSDAYAKVYKIKQGGNQVGEINIPKDMVVQSGTVETKSGSGAWGAAGTYLHLVLANAENSDIYINVGDLIEYVVGGQGADGIITTTVTVNSQGEHVLTATVADGSIALAKLDANTQAQIGKAHEHSNKTVLDGITAAKVNNWDSAYTKAHEHSNKTVLDGITATKVSAWDAAESNAKSYTESLLTWGSF